MAFDVCVCYGPEEGALGARTTEALEAAGYHCTSPGQGAAPDPARLGVPEIDFGGATIGLVLVTRRWTATGGLSSVLALAASTGTRPLLVWWDEDAPSDFSGDRRPDESIFYACFLPAHERLTALAAHVKEMLAS